MQGTFPGNGCLSDREAQPRQPVRHVALSGAAAEALALLPVAGAGQLSQRLPALAEATQTLQNVKKQELMFLYQEDMYSKAILPRRSKH